MSGETITRAALGRPAVLGELYNVRSDSFCGTYIFDRTVPIETVTTMDMDFCDIYSIHTNDISEKFKKLNVEGELQASIVAKLIPLQGSGEYLSDGKESARSVKMSLIYNIKTIDESINIYHRDYEQMFSTSAIENGMGTHVVVGISWGANLILSTSYANKDSQDTTKISGKLSANLGKLCASITGNASLNSLKKEKITEMKFDFRVFGDVLPKTEILPTNLESALELMKKLPSLVSNTNGGKGKPLSFRLLPISILQKHLKLSTSIGTSLQSIEECSLLRIVKLSEQVSAAKQSLFDFLQDATDFRFCISQEDIREISNFRDKIEIQESDFRSSLSSVLTKVRSGTAGLEEMEALIKKFRESSTSPENIYIKISEWSSVKEKIMFARDLMAYNVTYVGTGCSYDDEIFKEPDKTLMVFFYSKNSKLKNPLEWSGNQQILHQELLSNDKGYKFIVVDCDIHPHLQVTDETSYIQIVQGGKTIVQNVLVDQQKFENVAVAYSKSGTVPVSHPPNNRVPLSIKCVGTPCNAVTVYDWVCKVCEKPIAYGFNQFVYCECGKSPVNKLVFRCPDPKHGLKFKTHRPVYLREQLATVRPFQEINILILGETGVGKSTFINGFYNYLNYDTLSEAELDELHSLIPSKFTVYDQGKQIIVTTGEDANETYNSGQSATQTTKVYPFNIGKTTIRLIDTPGIGDTRGIEQDGKNVENILGTIAYLKEIHGILILLKPNESRISITFRFCIKQLLTHLHKDASENIAFCFTNSRGNFYRPGETMTPLTALLEEIKEVKIALNQNTIFCFDSEAYRYLAAVKNTPPVKFVKGERENFVASWETSVNEIDRLIQHIQRLKPHMTQSTINLNQTRQLVLQLSRPLAEISRNIQMNKELVEADKREIEKTDEDTKKLEERRLMKRIELEARKIDHPRTVCGHMDCKKIWNVSGTMVTEYTTICHEHCGLKGVQADSRGDPGLMKCRAFKKTAGHCRHSNCKHHYSDHLHIYYDSVQVEKTVEDQSVVQSLQDNLNAKAMKQKMIDDKNLEIQEYELELSFIEKACAKFACFLKCNAITPYNDALLGYLDYLISEEKDKVAAGYSNVTLQNLQNSKRSYEEQKRILEKSLENSDEEDTAAQLGPEHMERLVNQLKQQKHSGKALQDALDCVHHAKCVVYKEVVVKQKKKCNQARKFLKVLFHKKRSIE